MEEVEREMRTEFKYGKKVQEFRKARAWTQEQLAAAAELETRTVQRVEADKTKNAETLQAIAGALDVPVEKLRTKWRIAESKLAAIHRATSYGEFLAIQTIHRSNGFSKAIFAPLQPGLARDTQNLLDQVFADRELIEPDEPDLWKSYGDCIAEPLKTLFDSGFEFFCLDERRDLLLRHVPGLPAPQPDFVEGWIFRHFLLVGRHGCFQVSEDQQLHRFAVECRRAGEELLSIVNEPGKGAMVFTDALKAIAKASSEDRVMWCDVCFPRLHNGARIGFDYLEAVTGMTRAQLQSVCEAITGDLFIPGLA